MKNITNRITTVQNYFAHNNVARYILLVMSVLAGFLVPLLALVISLIISYKLLMLILNHKIFTSKFFVFMTAIFFYMLVLQAVILIAWLFSHDFPLTLCGPFTVIVLLTLYHSLKPMIRKPFIKKRSDFTASKISDIVPLVVCLLSFIVFMIFPMFHSGSSGVSGVTILVNRVIDDPNHLGMLNDRLNFNRGVITDSIAEGHTNAKGASFYPAGWHSANAVVIKAFYPAISTGSESLIAYAITKVFWFLFLVFMFVRSIFSLYGVYSKEKLTTVVSAWIGLASLLFVGWFLIDPFLDGFYSFLPQLIIVPLFVLSLIQLSWLNKGDENGFLNSLILPGLLCMGSALSWLLLLPVFAGALLLYSANLLYKWGIAKTLKNILKKLPHYLLLVILIIAPVIVQLITSKSTGGSVSFIEGILLPGPIQTYPMTFYDFILLGVGLFIVLAIKYTKIDRLQPILIFLLTVLAFTALIYLLQLYKSQANFYYYFKSLNAFTIAASMLCVVGFAYFINWAQSKTSRLTALLTVFMLVLVSVQFVFTKPLMYLYAQGGRATTVAMNKEIFEVLKTNYSQSHYFNKEVTIYYPNNNPNMNEVGSRLLSTNKPYSACYDSLKGASFSVRPNNFNVSLIMNDCADPEIKITYYVEYDSRDSMQQKIDENNLQNRVTLKTLE